MWLEVLQLTQQRPSNFLQLMLLRFFMKMPLIFQSQFAQLLLFKIWKLVWCWFVAPHMVKHHLIAFCGLFMLVVCCIEKAATKDEKAKVWTCGCACVSWDQKLHLKWYFLHLAQNKITHRKGMSLYNISFYLKFEPASGLHKRQKERTEWQFDKCGLFFKKLWSIVQPVAWSTWLMSKLENFWKPEITMWTPDWPNGILVNLHWKHFIAYWQNANWQNFLRPMHILLVDWPNATPGYWPKKFPTRFPKVFLNNSINVLIILQNVPFFQLIKIWSMSNSKIWIHQKYVFN